MFLKILTKFLQEKYQKLSIVPKSNLSSSVKSLHGSLNNWSQRSQNEFQSRSPRPLVKETGAASGKQQKCVVLVLKLRIVDL